MRTILILVVLGVAVPALGGCHESYKIGYGYRSPGPGLRYDKHPPYHHHHHHRKGPGKHHP